MGSSIRRKRSREPKRLLDAAPSTQGVWRPEDGTTTDGLTVPLVEVDAAILATTGPGARAVVTEEENRLEVDVNKGRLGLVAPSYDAAVRQSGLRGGHIGDIDRSTKRVMVTLTE